MPDETKARVAGEVGQIVLVAGDQVVDPDDFVLVSEEAVSEVGSEKARGAGDHDPHAPAFTARDAGDFADRAAAASGPRPIE
jgi:hypothetical protein